MATDHEELTERNRKLVEDFYSGVATGSPANPARLFHPDIVVHEPHVVAWGGVYRGAQGQRDLAAAQRPLLDPKSLTIHSVLADGAQVASVLTVHTTTGAPLMLSEHMTLIDGLITEQRVFVFGHPDQPLEPALRPA